MSEIKTPVDHEFNITAIGVVESNFKEKFGTPRQGNLVSAARGRVRLLPPCNVEDAFIGLEGCTHIWLQFIFHQNRDKRWRPKIRPPRLGGNARIGVFASRSPYRPNALGLSAVRLLGVRRIGGHLYVEYQGGDLVEGTPVVDIKPYVPYADALPDAKNSFAETLPGKVPVIFNEQALATCLTFGGEDLRLLVEQMLEQDPRPQYQVDVDGRVYIMAVNQWQVRWSVEKNMVGDLVINVIGIGSGGSDNSA